MNMKRIGQYLVIAAFFPVLFQSAAVAEQTYYVQSVKAKIMAEASFKSRMIAEVGRGYRLTGLGKSGRWVRVKYGSREGFVPALLVSPNPPLEKMSIIRGEDTTLQQNVRRRASTYTSAAAARGLTADDRRRLSKEEKVDFESLEQLEAINISEAEIMKFIEGGRQ